MSSQNDTDPYYLDGNGEDRNQISPMVPDEVQQHANANFRAFGHWFNGQYTASNVAISKRARWEVRRLYTGWEMQEPISRAKLCNDTIRILDAWATEPLVPGTKKYKSARIRLIRDIIYERATTSVELLPHGTSWISLLRKTLPTDPALAALKITKSDVKIAYHWIYQMANGTLARHRLPRLAISYPVLARDGVTTLPASHLHDNDHLPTPSPLPLPRTPLTSLSVNNPVDPNGHFHPYARPGTVTKQPNPRKSRRQPPDPRKSRGRSLAVLTKDPSYSPPDEDLASPDPVEEPAPFESSAINEQTLDELIQEAKDQPAIVGHTEAFNRGLLRIRRSPFKWAPDKPVIAVKRKQPIQDVISQPYEQPIQDVMSQAPDQVATMLEQAGEDAMSRTPEPVPAPTMEQAREDWLSQPPEQMTTISEQAAEDVILQASEPIPITPEQAEEDLMSQIPQVQVRGGFLNIVSPDGEQFEHFRYLDRL
ncbi:MAG: hypothetical protein Q9168_007896 [Polycauliona sp. 1 TL-2023]